MNCLEVGFDEWEWEEELHVLNLEDVGLGSYANDLFLNFDIHLLALIVNVIGLGISTFIFVIEKVFFK